MSFSFTGFTGYASSIFFSVFALYHLSSLFKLFTTSFVFVSWLAKLYMGTSFTLLDYFKISHSSDFSLISCFNPFIGYLSQASQILWLLIWSLSIVQVILLVCKEIPSICSIYPLQFSFIIATHYSEQHNLLCYFQILTPPYAMSNHIIPAILPKWLTDIRLFIKFHV